MNKKFVYQVGNNKKVIITCLRWLSNLSRPYNQKGSSRRRYVTVDLQTAFRRQFVCTQIHNP